MRRRRATFLGDEMKENSKYKIIESEYGKTFAELQEAAVSSLNSCMQITKKNVSRAILEALIKIK